MKMKNELFRKIVETHGRASLLALLLLLCPIVGMAQSNITISNFAAAPGTDGAPTTITFNIEWAPPEDEDKVWSDTVWVFVDYNNAGTMTRLPLATGATLAYPSWDGAKVMEVPDNNQGVWVVGNARATQGAFTATVQLLLVEAWRATSLHGLCIYAINYPPRAQFTNIEGDPAFKFTGTPPFYLTLEDSTNDTLKRKTAPASYTYTLIDGKDVTSFTDASRAPGWFDCRPAVITPLDTARCGSGTLTLTVEVSDPDATVNWYSTDSYEDAYLVQTDSASYDIKTELTKDQIYYVKVTNNHNEVCTSQRAITATVHMYEGNIRGLSDG